MAAARDLRVLRTQSGKVKQNAFTAICTCQESGEKERDPCPAAGLTALNNSAGKGQTLFPPPNRKLGLRVRK
jgi:hypothetical protein